MRVYLAVLWIWFSLLPAAYAAGEPVSVVRVINGKSLVLSSGDTVRLAGIEVPNVQEEAGLKRGAEPYGAEAKKALEALVLGRQVRIKSPVKPRDRHNRLLGQVTRDDGVWIQGELLKRGAAMVYSFADEPHDTIIHMLALEREAHTAKRGIWAEPYWRVVTPLEAGDFIGRFKIVEGRVVSLHEYHEHIYVNFSEDWRGHFAVFISRKHRDAFSLPALQAMVGKKVRVRGWIDYHNAPSMSLTHSEQIEAE